MDRKADHKKTTDFLHSMGMSYDNNEPLMYQDSGRSKRCRSKRRWELGMGAWGLHYAATYWGGR
jgi:hypothetical protein